ncbi:GPI-anchored surface protein, putative [Bodo saltans]|uniref:GPI-anchored surface protein, putative n=1 Tax=Bodo saltans TaxID=75058 RepID=A0A0S4JG33_BODSA|nr:GPI-anchored surface protein, putative [Bodo saltans]|eukprot:CUG89466.1 GPI-anchored surface protein, putative [Bodo saltans]
MRLAVALLLIISFTGNGGVFGDPLWYEDVLQFANESRTVEYPARRYCDGVASVSDDLLYETSLCTATSTQAPLFDTAVVSMQLVELRNLSFCCKSNYTSVLPVGTNVTAKDEEAKFLYEQALNGALLLTDCSSFYPFRTCAPCAYAYRSWVCSLIFPLACRIDGTTDGTISSYQAMPICREVCLEVVRKCPSVFQSMCPVSSSQYRNPIVPDAFVNVTSIGAGGCNPMNYDHARGVGIVVAGSTTSSSGCPSLSSFLVVMLVVLASIMRGC